ncbi:MAG: T9SS C-terminal target domain-containing protein [Calditrichaeota bacterium]|nr:MAG: T9SS C-terminal target domain-containing protein [Calditrichota bacterium]
MRTIKYLLVMFLIYSMYAQVNEYYFRIPYEDLSVIDEWTRLFSVDDVDANYVYGYANPEQWKMLSSMGLSPEQLPHPSSLYKHRMSQSPAEVLTDWDTYPTYLDYRVMMQQFATNYPDICRLDTMGYSVQGRLLLSVKITDNPDQEEDEPEFLYTSTMHGDETVGYVLLLRLIDYLLSNYGQPTPEGERVTHLVDNMEIWINPLFNPDGTYWGGNNTVDYAIRFNANGVDLNRNFPDRITDPDNTTDGREAETAAMMNFVREHNFNLSANFHGGAQVVNYPWDNGAPSGTYSACPDDSWFIDVSMVYASTNPDMLNGGFPNGITNGCDWYAIYGGRQDWIYYWHGGRETTIELWNIKNPPGSVLPGRWENNRESFLAYMEQAFKGIRGIVTDSLTGTPLAARIDIVGIDNAPVFTDPDVGDYHRLLLPGNYDVVVSADSYYTDTLYNVLVTDSVATRLDVALLPLSPTGIQTASAEQLSQQVYLYSNYPNPFNPVTHLSFRIRQKGWVRLVIYDLLGRTVKVLQDQLISPGEYEVSWNATNDHGEPVSSGVYIYQLNFQPHTQPLSVSKQGKMLLLR